MRKERIIWIDIAKALAIISVPVSHTVENPSFLRSLLFSFSMPIFFILSGFTSKNIDSKEKFWQRLKKNTIFILLPALVFFITESCLDVIINGGELISVLNNLNSWLIGQNYFGPGGMLWFLIVLYLAKTIMDLTSIILKTDKIDTFFYIGGILGMHLGVRGIRLPLFLDLVLVAMMYIEIGRSFKKNFEKIAKARHLMLLIMLGIWSVGLAKIGNIELAIRAYPQGVISIVISLAASYVICEIAQSLESCIKTSIKPVKKSLKMLCLLGQNTLIFYLIHSMDGVILKWLWDIDGQGRFHIISRVCLRLFCDFILFVTIFKTKVYIKNRNCK